MWLALCLVMLGCAPRVTASAVPDPVSGDLFLGVRAEGGTGGSVAYLVKIGHDSDGDGQPDVMEILAGTNPDDPGDFFHLQSLTQSPAGTSLTFHSIPARTYQVDYSQDLTSWQVIATLAGGPSPATTQYVDTDPVRIARPTGFYRIAVGQ